MFLIFFYKIEFLIVLYTVRANTMFILSKDIRWNIHSFINDIDLNKEKYNKVMNELLLRVYYNNNVLIRIKSGTRPVAEDQFGKCVNCYHFGPWKQFNGDVKMGIDVCAYHSYEDEENMKVSYMSFDEFISNSCQLMMDFSCYEEYREFIEESFRDDEDNKISYLETVDRTIREYNDSIIWNW